MSASPLKSPPSDRPSREPQLLHFRLRQMFFVVTLLSILCALLVLTTGVWPMIIGFGALLVAAHVGGNLIGTRLRDSSQQLRGRKSLPSGPGTTASVSSVGHDGLPAKKPQHSCHSKN